ncbi:MAG: class I SAM-dependent methyltransferase [Aliishimia sp.]
MSTDFLSKVYQARNPDETRALYDEWSGSYDAEIAANGYVTPTRCAAALAQFCDDLTAPILDFGCGTGLSGAALSKNGFTQIDGVDVSPDMLKTAQAKKAYRNLRLVTAGEDPIKTPGDYSAISAVGVIGAGAAPVSTFDLLINGLAQGGKMVLSFNDHTLEDPDYEGRITAWTDCGAARLLFREHGPHLPGINMSSTVYVIEKA